LNHDEEKMFNKNELKKLGAICAVFVVLLFTMAHVTKTGRHIYRVKDGTTASFEEMIEDIKSAQVVFIGEQHDNPDHHKTQLDVIQALHGNGNPLAIGLEMFKNENQHDLDAWVAGKIPEEDFIPLFLENWGFGFELYHEIFKYARENRIPLIGLNVPKEITRKVGQTGFKSLTDNELSKLPPDVTCELDQQYMDHLVMIFQYKRSTDRSFYFFCEAQVLWDQSMAWYLAEYMKENPKRKVVVLSGAIHSWKYGIPKQIRRYTANELRIIVPDLPVEPASISENDADYYIVHI
jgi:uncharacterized iron-regulated protein